jgi:hypothetical protein
MDAILLAVDPVARLSTGHNEDHGGVPMIRRFWPVVVVLALACAAAAAWLLRTPPTPSPAMATDPAAVQATPVTIATPATPAAKPIAEPARQPVGYDHYRAEMKRIRAERNKAQALEANERCIGGQRYRKVGSAWERAGNC